MNNQMESYKKNGYLLLKDFFSKEAISVILGDAKNVFLKQFIQKGYTTTTAVEELEEATFNEFLYRLFEEDIECLSNCGKQVQHLISLHQLALDDKILDILKSVGLSSPIISTRPVMYFNHPKLARQKVFYKVDAHQDWKSMQGSLNAVIIWLPLININKDLGALEILPKSHLCGLRTNHIENGFGMVALSEEEKTQLVSIEVETGDALLFSSFLIHQSGDNVTNKPRWSCHFRYNDLDEPTFIQRKYAHPYIYKPIDELLTPNFPLTENIKKTFTI